MPTYPRGQWKEQEMRIQRRQLGHSTCTARCSVLPPRQSNSSPRFASNRGVKQTPHHVPLSNSVVKNVGPGWHIVSEQRAATLREHQMGLEANHQNDSSGWDQWKFCCDSERCLQCGRVGNFVLEEVDQE